MGVNLALHVNSSVWPAPCMLHSINSGPRDGMGPGWGWVADAVSVASWLWHHAVTQGHFVTNQGHGLNALKQDSHM